MANPITKVS